MKSLGVIVVICMSYFMAGAVPCKICDDQIIRYSINIDCAGSLDSVDNYKRDLSIMRGDTLEYRRFHNEIVNSRMHDSLTIEQRRNCLIYSFIMAEQYHYPIAALDYVNYIYDFGIEIDSTMAKRIETYLKIAVSSGVNFVSFLAACRLYEIYDRGTVWIQKDKEKAKYYDKLSETIAKSLKD